MQRTCELALRTGPAPGPGQPATQTVVSAEQRNVAAVSPVDENFFVRMTLPVRRNLNSTSSRDEARTTLELLDVRSFARQLLGVTPETPPTTVLEQTRATGPARWIVVNRAGTFAYAITLPGLSTVPLAQSTSTSRPTIPLGARGIVNSVDGTQNLALAATTDQIPLPGVLGGNCAAMNDLPLPSSSVSPTQINAQAPDTLRPGLYVFQVRSLGNAQHSDPLVLNVLGAQ